MLVRAEGRMRTAMKILAVSTVVNVALNPLFIRTFGLGIRGSALATNVAMVALAAAGAVYFRSGKSSVREPVSLFAYDPKIFKRIISIGLSSFILQGMGVLQQIFVFRLIAAHGTEKDVALMGTGLRILFLCVYPVMGLVRALQPVIGINFGARQYARVIEALRVFSIGGTAFMALIWLPLTMFSRTVLGWMLPDTAITDTDVLNFRILIVTLPLMAGVFNGLTFFQAIGHGKTATILAVSRQILVFVPVVLILPVYFGVSGIYYSLTGVDVTLIAVLAMLVLREFKLLSAKPDGAER
ncbi:MAG TPA: MATE family efflux transporter [Leptospiraceae bacterium]|nr:MATE family efflux transporter [Leptospiraceae bacterium]